MAFLDAYFAPVVLGILTHGYTGQPGNVIVITARDNFKVNAVTVTIRNEANELIEHGSASINPDGITWSYVVTKSNPNVPGSVVKATAYDIPENEGWMEVVV